MAAISGGDQTLLREKKDTQYSIQRLYGFGYPVMWKGRVNDGSIARGDQTIVADTGAMEAGYVFANLGADLLLFVGTAEGLSDKGRRRILSVSGSAAAPTFIVDWNDDLDWSDGDYLTVANFYAPMPRHQWFTSSPIDFRVDGPPSGSGGLGVDYSDQNETPPPQVIMGSNYAGELVSGTLAVQLSAANSQAVADGASISSYAWAAVPTAGVSFNNAAIAAPIATFTADNSKYQISCTVTDDNGKTAIAHRCYIIGGAITEFSRGAITENYDKESVSCGLTLTSPETTDSAAIRPVMTWADFAEKTLVIITSEDHYGSTQKTITFRDEAQYTDHGHILFCGYLFSENDDLVDDGSGTVSLTAVSTIQMFLYSLSITGVETPTDWFEMDKTLMTVAGNIFHLLKYHSTLLDIMDWRLPWSDTVKRSANEEFGEGALLARAKALIGSRLMAMTATAQGEIWVETDLNLRDSTDRTAETTTLILTDDDITGTKRARRRHYGDQIRTLLDGGLSTGLLGSFTPFLSASQNIASAEGRPQMVNFSRIMLPDQTEANRLSGRITSVANSEYQEANLELSGNYRAVFSPGDQQKVDLGDTFAGSLLANIRSYTNLEDVNVIVRSVSNKHSNGYTSVSITADIMPDEGLTGVTLPFPVVPADAIAPGGGSGSFDEPPPPVYPPVPPNLAVAGHAVGIDEDDGVYWTADSGGSWEARNNGLATANGSNLIWDPWWKTAFGNNSSNPEDVILWWTGTGFVRRSIDAGKNWDDFTQYLTDPPNVAADAPAPTVADLDYHQIRGDIHDFGRFVMVATWTAGGGEERSWIAETTDNGFNWTWTELAVTVAPGTNPNTLTWLLDADPDQETYNDNDAVTTITNQGTGANGTGGTDPTFKTNIINGKSIYRFDSASSEFKTFGTGFGKPANFTILCVVLMDTTAHMNAIGSSNPAGDDSKSWGNLNLNHPAVGGSNRFATLNSDGSGVSWERLTNSLIQTGTFYIIGIRYTSGDTGPEVWINGSQTALTTFSSAASTNAGTAFQYIMGRNGEENADYMDGDIGRTLLVGSALTDAQMENLGAWIVDYYFPSTEIQVLTEDIDLENGNSLYMTLWNGSSLVLQNRQNGSFSTVNIFKMFGSATSAEVAARTFWIGCYCPPFFGTASLDDIVYVFGRWNDGTLRHVSKSTDGGSSFTDIGDSATWLTGWVGAFFATDASTLYAFVNGASRALYRSLNGGTSWTSLSSLPFDVDYGSISLHADGRIIIANRAAGAQMVAYADSPYSAWTNATGSPAFPTAGGGARSMTWVT